MQAKTQTQTRGGSVKMFCGEALYRSAWLCSRKYYIVPDMLSYRNVDAIMSYHMMLDRAR